MLAHQQDAYLSPCCQIGTPKTSQAAEHAHLCPTASPLTSTFLVVCLTCVGIRVLADALLHPTVLCDKLWSVVLCGLLVMQHMHWQHAIRPGSWRCSAIVLFFANCALLYITGVLKIIR